MESEWNNERTFELEKVSPVYIITALCVVPFAIYRLLSLLSPLVDGMTAMKISEIYVYPIKSLRGVKVNEALGTSRGFKHDRTFMLLQVTPEGPKPMAVSRQPEMNQFFQEIHDYHDPHGSLRVTFRAFGNLSPEKSITIPLLPDTSQLEPYKVTLHSSPAPAFKMPNDYNEWFTSCFGYPVLLLHLGPNTRPVLFQDMQPVPPSPLTQILHRLTIPIPIPMPKRRTTPRQPSQWRITFADCAPYLICSQTSLDDVSARLPPTETMPMTKFRPNIVIKGAPAPYQEDTWSHVSINRRTEIFLPHNCVRCTSINVDYRTGRQGVGAQGHVLKTLQRDRRIDAGARWGPVFGRYGFWGVGEGDQVLRVGDRVGVVGRNRGYTVWSWPGLA